MRRLGARALAVAVIAVVVVGGSGAYAFHAYRAHDEAVAAAPTVASTALAEVTDGPHIVFRSTAPGQEYGLVAMVPLDDPAGPRAFTSVACDRVDAIRGSASCLRIVRGVATRFEGELLDADWQPEETWPLPGVPSRTRMSTDGTLVATTSFVTGHSYATTGFSTSTVIHRPGQADVGNLEDFLFLVDGERFDSADRNFWGVTFVDDDTFYATAASASAGKTWLVRGSVSARAMTAVREAVECPSLSPDGTRIAFKKLVPGDGATRWTVAVLDLATMTEIVVDEDRNVDDQVEWLDDATLLYGLPREDEAGVTDVWAVDAQDGAVPRLFIPQAWSPSVVR